MELINDKCENVLHRFEENSIDAMVKDPPAGISFMGKDWDSFGKKNDSIGKQSIANKEFAAGLRTESCGYFKVRGSKIDTSGRNDFIKYMTGIFEQCLRILKPGAHALVWALPRTSHWTATALENAGFEIRDVINHIFGSGFPKSLSIDKSLDSIAKKRWIHMKKNLDNLKNISILGAWKKSSKNVKFVEKLLEKNLIEIGMNTLKSDFVQESVSQNISQKKLNVFVYIVDRNFLEANPTLKQEFSVVESVEPNIQQSKLNVKFAVKKLLNKKVASKNLSIYIVVLNVKELQNENSELIIKAEETLMTYYGNVKLLNEQNISALCVELIENLKLTILNHSKTFQNSDMKSQMDYVSATNVIIMESTAANLISSTVNILKNKVIDKIEGANREIISPNIRLGDKKPYPTNPTHVFYHIANAPDLGMITVPATSEAKQWKGWGTALKPACEHWILCRKPLSEKTIAENVLKWGTGGINIDGCRVGNRKINESGWSKTGSKASQNIAMSGSNYERKPKSEIGLGRFPANVVTDGSEEVLAGFPNTKSGGHKRGSIVNANHRTQSMSGTLKPITIDNEIQQSSGSAARFFYCAKASKRDRDEGLEDFFWYKVNQKDNWQRIAQDHYVKLKKENDIAKQNGEKPKHIITTGNIHETVKATDLMRYLCRLITPPGGTVIDPFMGSGSTGKAAILEGFGFYGIEDYKDYFDMAEARINFVLNKKENQYKLAI